MWSHRILQNVTRVVLIVARVLAWEIVVGVLILVKAVVKDAKAVAEDYYNAH